MNKRYIDFAPVKKKTGARGAAPKKPAPQKSAPKGSNAVAVRFDRPKSARATSNGVVSRRAETLRVRSSDVGSIKVRPGKMKPAKMKPTMVASVVMEPDELDAETDWMEDVDFDALISGDVTMEELFGEREEIVEEAEDKTKLGVIEDFRPKFVKSTEVKKRPLGGKKAAAAAKTEAKSGLRFGLKAKTEAKVAEAAGAKASTKAAAKAATKPRPLGVKTAFVNVNKIEKRPLSGSTHTKKPVIVPKPEKKQGPEKIIAKPEKDSKAGLIIAIILTIILGAAAGTVAFLLLPK